MLVQLLPRIWYITVAEESSTTKYLHPLLDMVIISKERVVHSLSSKNRSAMPNSNSDKNCQPLLLGYSILIKLAIFARFFVVV